jgi:hypothetical protein
MEIGKSFFWKKHGKLPHGKNLAPKIFPDFEQQLSHSLKCQIHN